MGVIAVINGRELRPGMIVSKPGEEGRPRLITIQAINRENSKCEHGYHFGNGCYDFIGSWLVWGKAEK